jgi:hypothetical protein
MAEPTTAELQAMARRILGREVSPAEAEAHRMRLPYLARTRAMLRDWTRRIGDCEPATVYRVPESDAD